jgi:hypothetical protein
MTDPKTFTGPEGWQFRIADKNVFIGNLNGDFPVGVIVPLAELGAFLQQPETAAAFEALAPAKPIDFRAGTFTRPGEPFSLDGGQTFSGLRGPIPQGERVVCAAHRFHAFRGIDADEARASIRWQAERIDAVQRGYKSAVGRTTGEYTPGAPDEPHNHWCKEPCGAPGCEGSANRIQIVARENACKVCGQWPCAGHG